MGANKPDGARPMTTNTDRREISSSTSHTDRREKSSSTPAGVHSQATQQARTSDEYMPDRSSHSERDVSTKLSFNYSTTIAPPIIITKRTEEENRALYKLSPAETAEYYAALKDESTRLTQATARVDRQKVHNSGKQFAHIKQGRWVSSTSNLPINPQNKPVIGPAYPNQAKPRYSGSVNHKSSLQHNTFSPNYTNGQSCFLAAPDAATSLERNSGGNMSLAPRNSDSNISFISRSSSDNFYAVNSAHSSNNLTYNGHHFRKDRSSSSSLFHANTVQSVSNIVLVERSSEELKSIQNGNSDDLWNTELDADDVYAEKQKGLRMAKAQAQHNKAAKSIHVFEKKDTTSTTEEIENSQNTGENISVSSRPATSVNSTTLDIETPSKEEKKGLIASVTGCVSRNKGKIGIVTGIFLVIAAYFGGYISNEKNDVAPPLDTTSTTVGFSFETPPQPTTTTPYATTSDGVIVVTWNPAQSFKDNFLPLIEAMKAAEGQQNDLSNVDASTYSKALSTFLLMDDNNNIFFNQGHNATVSGTNHHIIDSPVANAIAFADLTTTILTKEPNPVDYLDEDIGDITRDLTVDEVIRIIIKPLSDNFFVKDETATLGFTLNETALNSLADDNKKLVQDKFDRYVAEKKELEAERKKRSPVDPLAKAPKKKGQAHDVKQHGKANNPNLNAKNAPKYQRSKSGRKATVRR